ncbi:Metallo-dependent phosphatase [Coniophora puteana RWD-64-598 SS2]|uniref:Metallo-dependent phosphatase n=1 Tax=Coniophora puteana (strain RWD-64-598) TaxID=741705 RepID=A0A5M3MSU8_CONPW|nr:Metallo-dependent phosphatase [Coniophora puteana RWD-64-598 SS2]EIW81814.1 Metallo-dependent phosphatase [Coniophora puteana RWD-64-598 SS2]
MQGVFVRAVDRGGLTWEQYSQSIEAWRTKGSDTDSRPKPETNPSQASTGASNNVLKIAHFNDVYQVSNQKLKEQNVDVMKFATMLSDVRKKWAADGIKEGLTIFSGDTFSPSFQSAVTRGRHMASVMNALDVEISVAGNHEFDFGYRRLSELIEATNFPWLLSNIIDTNTGSVPEPMKSFHVLEKSGVRIGFIGLVEKAWIATITGWPDNFEWKDTTEVGLELSKVLRDPAGPHKCDMVFALTHARIPNDIKMAEELFALSPKAQAGTDIISQHGVDILLGGHDHIYWISKGLRSWDGYDVNETNLDAQTDKGDTLIIKSGTDFQDLSEVTLTLKDTPPGSVRRKVIESIKGVRHVTTGDLAVDPHMKNIIDGELAELNAAMADPILISEVELDARSLTVRTGEAPVGNWIADCLRPAYNDVLEKSGYPPVDGVIVCTGDIRGDATYSKGPITLGDLMQMLPFTDPTVVAEMTGDALWTAMESGLSKWPVQEGRFPAISGFRVEWKSSNESGNRVQGIWLQEESKEVGPDGKLKLVDKEEIRRTSDRKYLISVGEYMAQGGDGYDVLKDQKLIIDGENGQSKSTLIRKFLLGKRRSVTTNAATYHWHIRFQGLIS